MQYYHFSFSAMGSPCNLHIYSHSADGAKTVSTKMQAEIQRLEKKYSRYRDDSMTSGILRCAQQGKLFNADEETAGLLDYAQQVWQQSDGLFDITSGVLRHAWQFPHGSLPSSTELELLLPRIGWDKVYWQNRQLGFARSDMELDFGGIVKEYAADCAAAIALENGIHHGLVELGGDIRVIGAHPDGRQWKIGIRHPRIPGQVWATLSLASGALASSGDYERCIIHEGIRYGHVLNPRTGWPVQGLIAVSAVAEHCLLAGSLATLALLASERDKAWLDEFDTPWLAMDGEGNIYGTLADSPCT